MIKTYIAPIYLDKNLDSKFRSVLAYLQVCWASLNHRSLRFFIALEVRIFWYVVCTVATIFELR